MMNYLILAANSSPLTDVARDVTGKIFYGVLGFFIILFAIGLLIGIIK